MTCIDRHYLIVLASLLLTGGAYTALAQAPQETAPPAAAAVPPSVAIARPTDAAGRPFTPLRKSPVFSVRRT